MSLIKVDENGYLKESWADKKSIKRLKTILEKGRLRYQELKYIMNRLKMFNIEIEDDLGYKYMKMVQSCAQLSVYIDRKKREL